MKNSKKEDEEQVYGAINVAILQGYPSYPNIVCTSVYNIKPVQLIYMQTDIVKWFTNEVMVW